MSVEKLEALIVQSPYPWWEWNPATDHLLFNPLKATNLGYRPSELQGRGFRAFTELLHQDDVEKAMTAMRRVLYGAARLYQVDYRIRDKSGVYRWHMDRGCVLSADSSGTPRLIRGIVIDLGKEAETAGCQEAAYRIIKNSFIEKDNGAKSILTICASCKRVKVELDEYTEIRPELWNLLSERVSHGVCPECIQKLYPDLAGRIMGRVSADQRSA